ncbi:MAG: glycosyltransferase family 4 protein [Deltaproteobacteria bacterium]|nr:glycosyltransferase family 4 protein [Deltaproteobacteria bacterium]
MRILIVHQYYLFPGQPGGSRFNEFARQWAASGHDVTVVAGSLNYATNEVDPECRGKWTVLQQDGEVTVWRCHVPSSYGNSYIGRAWAFLGFTLSAATAAIRARDVDVVIATSPPLVAALPGYLAARLHKRKIPWVFEIRDLWPESAVSTGVLSEYSVITKGLYALEKFACNHAARINVLTPAFEEDIVKRGLVPRERVVFIPNGADVGMFTPQKADQELRKELGWEDKFVVMYCGAHGRANALHQLIEAAEVLRERKDILIACVGDGPERRSLETEASRRELTNIVFNGPRSKSEMPSIVNACDVGAAVLQDNPTFRTVYPNKVFDYMSCEKPTLLAIDGVAREMVCNDARAGIFARPEDCVDIAEKISRLMEDEKGRNEMGRRGRKWVLENATRESLAERYLEVLQGLFDDRKRNNKKAS